MLRTRNFSSLLLAVALAFTFGARSASADTFTSILNVGNTGLTNNGFSGPYGTVTVNLTSSTTADITFTSNTVTGQPSGATNPTIFLFGGAQAVDVQVNATSWSTTIPVGTNAGVGFTPGPFSNGGSSVVDGFGTFNQTFDSFDGYTHASDTVTFMLTNTSGTWAAAANVLNGEAAHMFPAEVQSSDGKAHATINTYDGMTGFAMEGPAAVPEPSTLAIAGLGALGFVGYGLRRRLKK